MGERRRENEIKEREREGGVKQMCQNCIPTMNMNTLCAVQDSSDRLTARNKS